MGVVCSNCNSTNITLHRKGFNGGDACMGAALCGPLGLAAGGLDSNTFDAVCNDCGAVRELIAKPNCCGGTTLQERTACLIPLIIAGIGFATKAWAFIISVGLK